MFPADVFLKQALARRLQENSLRTLFYSEGLVDFASNDYLGFAHSKQISAAVSATFAAKQLPNGSGGSRLLSGNSSLAEELEHFIATFHQTEAALLYTSGYAANTGFFSAVPQRGDTVLYDELIHASVRDGLRMSFADHFSFRHNDAGHLEERLQKTKGNVFVAVESIYSMDGDAAPLAAMVALCEKYAANLVVDEAHALGVFGKGLCNTLNLQHRIFAIVYTYGKALGCHGAAIAGNKLLKEFLINFSRAFIYSTALPPHTLLTIKEAYSKLAAGSDETKALRSNIDYFKHKLQHSSFLLSSESAIQCLILPGTGNVKKVAATLRENGFDVRAVLAPTVPKGKERIRICLHAYNTREEIDALTNEIINLVAHG